MKTLRPRRPQEAVSRRRGLTLLELVITLVILLALSTMVIPVLSWIGQRSQAVATQDNLVRLREVLVNRYYPDMGELPRPRAELTSGGAATRLNHPQLVYLFVNPDKHEDALGTVNDFDVATNMLAGRRWQGPYVTHSGSEYFVTDSDADLAAGTNYTARYGAGDAVTRVGDPTVIDAWGNPIVVQEPDADASGGAPTRQERMHARLVSPGLNGIVDVPPDVLMPTLAERGDDLVLYLFRHDEFGDGHLTMEP